MNGYDAWLTTDVEYEKAIERGEYCADNMVTRKTRGREIETKGY
jgi:hypothetical protein